MFYFGHVFDTIENGFKISEVKSSLRYLKRMATPAERIVFLY